MIRTKLICGVLLAVGLSACQEDGSREVVTLTSPDGQEFHYMPVWEDDVTDITITMAWPMAWGYQEGRNPAVPYIAAEAVLSGGTDELPPSMVMEMFNDANAFGSIVIFSDHAVGELTFPKEHMDEVLDITTELLATPQFDDGWTGRLVQNTIAGQEQVLAQSSTALWGVARRWVLGDTPLYDFKTVDDLDQIAQITSADLAEWHAETITRTDVTVAVTGAISEKDAGKAVDQILRDLPAPAPTQVALPEPNFAPVKVLLHMPEAEKTTLGMMGRLPSTRDGKDLTDVLALQVFNQTGGPLFEAIRTELRATYGLQAGYDNYNRDTRVLYITGEIDTAKLAEATDVVLTTYEAFRTNPDLSSLDDIRADIAHGTTENVSYVDVAAYAMIELALDGLSVTSAPKLGYKVSEIMGIDVTNRLRTDYPAADELMIFAVSPDATALPGACVIQSAEQVLDCPAR